MQEKSDAQLLREYAQHANEAAFREIVNRHAGLVYSAALRQVISPDLARNVAQSIFTDLARKAPALAQTLTQNSSLLGWLYRSTRFTALNQLRDDRRRLARERQVMQHFDPAAETAPDWNQVQPVLDEAMADLSDEDRDALLLRFFKNRDFRAIGATLGVSDDAAQKRVSRALERLRIHLTNRGVTTTAVALSTLLSANAVPVVPAGLVAALSASALAGTAAATAATLTATKTIAMTALQKTIVTATIAVLAGVGIYEARQASHLREQVQTLHQQQGPLAEQIQQLQQERDAATNRLAWQTEELAHSNSNKNEVLRLRGDIGVLRQQLRNTSAPPATRTRNDGASPNPSAIVFESVLIDDQRHRINNSSAGIVSVTIPPTVEKLEIHYKVPDSDSLWFGHFAYQLRGVESDWMEAGTNCVARYDKLPIGRYPFTVKLFDTNGLEMGSATLNLTVSQQARSVQITQSRPANRSATNNPAGSSQRLVNEFIGTLLGVDAQAQTVTVASGSPRRANLDEGKTYFLTPETKLFKGQLPTTLADGIIGQEVRYGFRINREANKSLLTVLRFMPEAKESAN